jgi:hypothetical protein
MKEENTLGGETQMIIGLDQPFFKASVYAHMEPINE